MTCDTPDGTDITVPQRERERDAERPFAGGASASLSGGPDHLGARPRVWPIEAPTRLERLLNTERADVAIDPVAPTCRPRR